MTQLQLKSSVDGHPETDDLRSAVGGQCHDQDMATIGDRILDAIRHAPLDDDVLAKRLGISQRQSVNQTARRLEAQGLLRRIPGPDGKIVNELLATGTPEPMPPARSLVTAEQRSPSRAKPAAGRNRPGGDRISEDEVKEAVRAHLASHGFKVKVAWGRTPGIDVDASHQDGRRFVIEAKAEVGSAGAQQHNYFVGMLGELVQRMSDPGATYAIALPDNRQYRGLFERLPVLAKERFGLVVFWVDRGTDGLNVEVDATHLGR